jgi:hypothetical protein
MYHSFYFRLGWMALGPFPLEGPRRGTHPLEPPDLWAPGHLRATF